MQVKISDAEAKSNSLLQSLGFSPEQAELTTRNLLEAELVGKSSHGFVRLPAIKTQLEKGNISLSASDYSILSESEYYLYVDGHRLPGWYLMYKTLELAITRSERRVTSIAIKDAGYATGYMGDYARIAAERNLIFIGCTNSPGWTVPFGSTKGIWGTNPLTIGVPGFEHPIIFDAASTKISVGEILIARAKGTVIKEGVALDKGGYLTTDAEAAYAGASILPIAGHKGSGLAFIIELLAGGMTNSRLGNMVNEGWGGAFYLLIDPAMFRSVAEFKADIAVAITELKSQPRAKGVDEIFYAGERSGKRRAQGLAEGFVDLDEAVWEQPL